jgi:vesicle transport through interaction with t-SNAREs protein 1
MDFRRSLAAAEWAGGGRRGGWARLRCPMPLSRARTDVSPHLSPSLLHFLPDAIRPHTEILLVLRSDPSLDPRCAPSWPSQSASPRSSSPQLAAPPSPRPEPLRTLLRKVASDLDEADELLSQLEVELASIPTSVRPAYVTKFKGCKAQLDRLKKQLVRLACPDHPFSPAASALARSNSLLAQRRRGGVLARLLSTLLNVRSSPALLRPQRETRAASNRSELLSDPSLSDQPSSSSDYSARTRLLAGTSQLSDGSRRLEGAQRLALETEDVGADILRNLRGQREQIEHSRDVLVQADGSIDRASGILKKMVWRMYQQKAVTYAIIAILVVLIGLVVWSKLRG